MKQVIKDRLERYTDLPESLIDDITRQVMIALDVDDTLSPVVMSENDYEGELEREYDRGSINGQRMGYMQAMDDIKQAVDTSDVESEANCLKVAYLDNH